MSIVLTITKAAAIVDLLAAPYSFEGDLDLGGVTHSAALYESVGGDLPGFGPSDLSSPRSLTFSVLVTGTTADTCATYVSALIAVLPDDDTPSTICLKPDGGTRAATITARRIDGLISKPFTGEEQLMFRAIVSFTLLCDPYVYGAQQTVVGSALPPAPVGSNWAADYLSSTYGAGDAVVALRFDDSRVEDWTVTLPRLEARGLHAGFAIPYCLVDHSSSYLTLAELQRVQSGGHEIMCHSYTHDTSPASYSEFYHETVDAKAALEALGFTVASFVQPGTWSGAYDIDPGNWTMGSNLDLLLRANFDAYEGYYRSMFLTLPVASENRYGAQHYSPDCYSAGGTFKSKDEIDYAIAHGTGVELLFHSQTIGGTGISVADFESTLDYLQTKQTAGDLTVLTPTQYLYAVQS